MLGKATKALEEAYLKFNEELFQNSLPEVCITIQHEKKRGKSNMITLGWFSTGHVWKDTNSNTEMFELNITSNGMNKPFIDIMGTLIHEMVHVYCHTHGIEDVTGKKHNEDFKSEAEKVGLTVEKDKKVGWGITYVSIDLRNKIVALDLDDTAFDIECMEVVEEKPPKEPKPKPMYVCPTCKEKVSSKKTDLAILCVKCREQFELVYEEPKQKED